MITIVRSSKTIPGKKRNKNGRTPFTKIIINSGKRTVIHGEFLDSEEDYIALQKFSEEMQEVHEDYLRKSAGSIISAQNSPPLLVCV